MDSYTWMSTAFIGIVCFLIFEEIILEMIYLISSQDFEYINDNDDIIAAMIRSMREAAEVCMYSSCPF